MQKLKKLSLIIVILSMILQPFITLPFDVIAEGFNGDTASVTVDDVTLENESGEALSEIENEEDALLALSWQKTEGEADDAVHVQLPESLSIHSTSGNELTDAAGANVGNYELISNREVRLSVSAEDATDGKLSLPVTVQSEETGEQTLNIAVDGVNHPVTLVILPSGREVTETAEKSSDDETEQNDDEEDPDPEEQIEDTSEDMDSNDDAFSEGDAEATEDLEQDDAQMTTFDVGALENGADLGNIFTFSSFRINDEEIENGDFLDISPGTTVQLEYAWDTNGLNASAGDTASIQLPEIFEQVNISNQPVETDGIVVGTYSIIDGEVTFVFNEAIEDGAVNNGIFGLNLQFDLEQFEENIEQVIEFNDRDETTLTVRARPDGEVSGINKRGRPDRNPNAREIIWEIDVINATEGNITDAILEDIIPDGLGEAGDFVIQELSVGINGNITPGEINDEINPEVDGNEFSVSFDEMGPYQGYRIQYRTTIEDYEEISFTNDAEFRYGDTKLPAEATVSGLERSNPVQKSGHYNWNTGQINWTITVNESGDVIDEAIVNDELPDGLILVDDSIVIHRYNDNWQWLDRNDGESDFPINLGSVSANEIYRIEFVTDIDWSEVNAGEYQIHNEFTNETNLTDGETGETPLGNDNATVDFRRESLLEKAGVSNVNYNNNTLTWTVTVNAANHPLDNVVVNDIIPDGLSISQDDIVITGEDGQPYEADNVEVNGSDVRIELGDIGTETITITYETTIVDFSIDEFPNTATLEGDGDGIGVGDDPHEDSDTIRPPANSFGKSFESIDYSERIIDWSLTVNPIREPITELEIIDTFPSRGLILLPDSLEVRVGGDVFTDGEGFTLIPNEEDGETGYHKGFILEFDSGLLPLEDEMTIVYTTSYDPQFEVDGDTPDPHAGDDDRIYQNDAQFIGNTADNNPFGVEREADTIVREDSWNSGYKTGYLMNEDEDENLASGWTSGNERKIAWELYVNYLQQNLGTDVTITDTLDYEGTIDAGSITVSVYDVDTGGYTTIPEDTTVLEEGVHYTVDVEGDEFALDFIDGFVVDERYVIEFTTTVPDISQPNYTNNATVSVGDDEYPYSGTVNFDRHDDFLEKGAIGLDGNQVFTGDEVEWNVRVNESLSVIQENVVITDTISEGLVYLEDSLSISTVDGRDLNEGEDYRLEVTSTDDGETVLIIELDGNLSETLVLNYTTVVTQTDGQVYNAIELSGENIETESVTSQRLNARQFSWIGGNYNPNRGAIRLEKFDADEEVLIENNEATFELWYALNNDRVQYTQVDGNGEIIPFTTENGVLEIGNLPLRTYYLTEVESPEGYVLSEEEIEIAVNTAYGSDEFTHDVEFENTKEQIDITGTKVWEGGEAVRPDSIELQLYRDEEAYGDPVPLEGTDGTPVVLNVTEESPWEYTWLGLDRTDIDGNEYEYRVEELNVPENFDSLVSEDGLTVTNVFVSPLIEIPVQKIWEDGDNQDGIRPDSIEVELFANGEATEQDNLLLEGDSDWQGLFTEIPEFDSAGEEIEYTVIEADVPEGYESVIEGETEEGYIITNSYTPEVMTIAGEKIWDDADNQDGERPESITVNLLANGVEVDSTEVTADDDNWSYEFVDFPVYEDGEEINYTVQEDAVGGYQTVYNGYDITNSYTPGLVSVTVTKAWQDSNNQDGIRPDSVTVALLANGEATGEEVVLNAENSWQATFTDLDEYQAGELIDYTVQELDEAPYESTISGDAADGYLVTNSHTPEVIDISGNKIWDDANDQDGVRPASITVNLLVDETIVDSAEITPEDNWSYVFENLDRYENQGEEIEYSVEEASVPEDYEVSYDGFNIINSYTPEVIDISGEKAWDDADNQDGARPESITVNLLANGVEVDSVEVTDEDNWNYEFESIPRYESGVEINYTVQEDSVEDYQTTYEGYDITNSYTPGLVSVTVTKAWDDANNQDGIRPDSVTIALIADEEATGEEVVLSAENSWQATFTDLDEYQEGELIAYTVEEVDEDPYESTISGDAADGYVVTNSYTPEVVGISGEKIWNDANNQDGVRPDSITVNLLAGETVVDNVEVTSEEGWSYAFENLDRYQNQGEEIEYTVIEADVPEDYDVSYDGFNIINSYTPEVTDITGEKIWDDADNQDGARPESITVNLWANGVEVDSLAVTADGNWSYEFLDFPVYEDGEEITYTVQEEAVEGYQTVYDEYDITNSYTPGLVSVTITKLWDDANNQDGNRPEEIVVELIADGETTDELTALREENNWQATFTDLDEYQSGQLIEYTIEEVDVPDGYESLIIGDAANGFIITNSYEPEFIDISGEKTWNDADNQDGARSESITVNLLANGEAVESVEVSAEDNWNYEFENIPRFENGEEINYTVQEDTVEGYQTVYDGYDITNSYTPGLVSVTVTKVWDDTNNQDGIRPDLVAVALLANEEATGEEVVLSAENNWQATFTDLDEYQAGELIDYTVEELDEAPYESTISGNAGDGYVVTNSYTPEVTTIAGEKTWDDANDQDSARPESITVNLLANGLEVDSVEVTADDNWSYEFVDVPVYEDGEEIDYRVQEDAVEGYQTVYDGYDITNSYTPGLVSVTATKVWQDDNNAYDSRTDYIIVELLADNEETGQQLELSKENSWQATFTDLDEYQSGELIDYTIKEVDIPDGYESIINGNAKDGYIITNVYIVPENQEDPTDPEEDYKHDDSEDDDKEGALPQTNESNMNQLYIVGGILLVALGATIVIVEKKKKLN